MSKDKHVRVIVLIEDVENNEEIEFKKIAQDHFLKGYDKGDSVCDQI